MYCTISYTNTHEVQPSTLTLDLPVEKENEILESIISHSTPLLTPYCHLAIRQRSANSSLLLSHSWSSSDKKNCRRRSRDISIRDLFDLQSFLVFRRALDAAVSSHFSHLLPTTMSMHEKTEAFYRSIFADLTLDREESAELVEFFEESNPPPDTLVWLRATAFRLACERLGEDNDQNVALLRCVNAMVHALEQTCME